MSAASSACTVNERRGWGESAPGLATGAREGGVASEAGRLFSPESCGERAIGTRNKRIGGDPAFSRRIVAHRKLTTSPCRALSAQCFALAALCLLVAGPFAALRSLPTSWRRRPRSRPHRLKAYRTFEYISTRDAICAVQNADARPGARCGPVIRHLSMKRHAEGRLAAALHLGARAACTVVCEAGLFERSWTALPAKRTTTTLVPASASSLASSPSSRRNAKGEHRLPPKLRTHVLDAKRANRLLEAALPPPRFWNRAFSPPPLLFSPPEPSKRSRPARPAARARARESSSRIGPRRPGLARSCDHLDRLL